MYSLFKCGLILFFMATSCILVGQKQVQNGFYINVQSDTVSGVFQLNEDHTQLKFKTVPSGDYTILKADSISSVYLNDLKYIPKTLETNGTSKTYFLEELLSGGYSLYYGDFEGGTFFLNASDSQFWKLENKEIVTYKDGVKYIRFNHGYMATLKVIFQDYPDFSSKIDQTTYTHQSLSKLIKGINQQYFQETPITESTNRNSIEFSFSLLAGVTHSYFGNTQNLDDQRFYYYLRNVDFKSKVAPTFGMDLKLTSSKNGKLGIRLVSAFFKRSTNSDHVYEDTYNHLRYRTHIKVEELVFNQNLQVQYRFLDKNLIGYLLLGVHHQLLANQKYTRETNEYWDLTDSYIDQTYTEKNIFSQSEYGPSTALMFSKPIKNKTVGMLMEYQQGYGYFQQMRTNRFSMMVFYQFN